MFLWRMQEKHYFYSDGLKLCGILSLIKETKKCIVLCHGLTSNKDEAGIFVRLADRLVKEGFAVFRFDFRAHGESQGDSENMTVLGKKKDLESAVDFLKEKGYSEFGILGASFAGGAVSLFTAENQEIVKALCLWNAVIDYDCMLNPKLPWLNEKFGKKAMELLDKQGFIVFEIGRTRFKLGKKLFDEIKDLKPWQKLKGIKPAILFVHGDKDTHIPYEDSAKYSRLLNAKLETIHGADHGFYGDSKSEEMAEKATIEFFRKNISYN